MIFYHEPYVAEMDLIYVEMVVRWYALGSHNSIQFPISQITSLWSDRLAQFFWNKTTQKDKVSLPSAIQQNLLS